MVVSYRKGRVFHTTLGPDVPALNSVDFFATFHRGTARAATGKVTQRVPANFPAADSVKFSNRSDGHGSELRERSGRRAPGGGAGRGSAGT
jgi:hypothetical protein